MHKGYVNEPLTGGVKNSLKMIAEKGGENVPKMFLKFAKNKMTPEHKQALFDAAKLWNKLDEFEKRG